jgi:acetyl-CoA C-acetyltransferase
MVGPELESAVAQSTDYDYEAVQGMTPTTQAALLMQRYLHDSHAPRDAFAAFPMLAHANAAGNPNAMFRKAMRKEAYDNAEMLSDPLNLFDMAPYADGAAAVVLTRAELLPKGFAQIPVRISGSCVSIDTLALHDRPDPLAFHAAGYAVEGACRQAGILPADVDLFEYCDAFSIYAVLSLEAAGFAKRGEGWKLGQDGSLGLKGKMPVATLGGLKGRGNPLGATGVYQIIEAVQQLRGQAGPNQIPDARRALVQSLGGPASTAIAHVLERLG